MPKWFLVLVQEGRRIARERRQNYDTADVWLKRELHMEAERRLGQTLVDLVEREWR